MSGIRPPDCSKLAENPKNDNDVTNFRHDVSVKFFWRWFVSLIKFSDCSKFHVNIITGSGIMTIFFYKGLTRNPEIGNTPFWVLSNIWRLGRVMDTKFGTNVSNRMLLNAAKCQGYSFYSVWGGGRGKITPHTHTHTPRLGLKLYSNPPSWLARSHCHMSTFWKTKDWSSHFWESQPFRFWYVEVHCQRRL